MARVYAGEAPPRAGAARSGRAAALPARRRPPRRGDDLEALRRRGARSSTSPGARRLRAAAPAGPSPAQPRRPPRGRRRRSPSTPRSASPPTPTGRPTAARSTMSYLTQMARARRCRTSCRPRPAWRCSSRSIRGFARRDGRRRSAASGSISTRTHALHPAAALARPRARPRLAGRRRRRSRPYATRTLLDPSHGADGDARRRAGHRARPGRLAGRDQAARHERRRLLQRQLGPPAREPDAALELPRGARDPAHPRRALLHVRRDGEGPAPGLGALRRDARHLRPAAPGCDRRAEQRGNPALAAARRRPGAERARRPAATWRARRSRFGIVDSRASGRPRPPPRRTARSTRCTTASRRSAASCRCG